MYSSSNHSQFDLAAARRWFTRRHRWASGLTAAALVLFLHQAGNAHDGSHGHDHPGPPPVVTLQITGLQKVYSVGQPVSGQVVVTSTERLKDSRLKIVMVDPDTCVSPTRCPQLFRQSYEVELKRRGSKAISFRLPKGAVSAYTLTATLTGESESHAERDRGEEKKLLATAQARFGIRQAALTGVNEYILKAEVASLNVPGILALLSSSSDNFTPVTLFLGSRQVTVRVAQQQFLTPGVALPNGVGRPLTFSGPLVDALGAVANSQATFTAPLGQLSAMIHVPNPGLQSIDTLWISPLSYMQTGAAPDRYVIYLQSRTLPHPKNGAAHGEPVVSPPPVSAAVRQAAPQEALTIQALAGTFPVKYVVEVQVYEHEFTALETSYRWTLVTNWASHLKAKFSGAGIPPRKIADCLTTGCPSNVLPIAVVVDEVHINSWRTISSAGYGDVCKKNLENHFIDDTQAGANGGLPFARHPQVLFTKAGTDCGGIGVLGNPKDAGEDRRLYSLTRDQVGFQGPDTMVLMQETGHNLDWHDSWCVGPIFDPCSQKPHNSHTDTTEISQTELIALGPLFRCTAMHGSYNDCNEPQPTYSWSAERPLQHLAEGIANMFMTTE